MTRTPKFRRTVVAAATALCLLLSMGIGNASVDVATAVDTSAYIDPSALAAVNGGASRAVLSWDAEAVSRQDVVDYLERSGIRHGMFSDLSMAVACAATAADLALLARAPGAISVWGDEPMTPILNSEAINGVGGGRAAAAVANPISVPGVTGKGVGIAVLDTGIDGTHPDLAFGPKTVLNARVLVSHMEITGVGNDTCAPDQFDDGVRDSETVSGHGTALAGIAAGNGTASTGQTKGVAPEAALVGLNVVDQATPQHTGDVSVSLIRFLAGVNYVISRSLDGGPTISKVALLGWTSEGLHDPWHPHALAIRDLHDFGITPVVPVGNGGPQDNSCDQAATCKFNRLAAGDFAVGVGATPPSGTSLEDYSSRGDPIAREARDEIVRYQPTIVAPGTGILGARRLGLAMAAGSAPGPYQLAGQGAGAGDDPTNRSYQAMTGTSVAAAQVAGTVALMQQAAMDAKGCFLTTDQVRQILQQTATAMAYETWQVGAGSINAVAAVDAARAATRIPSVDPWMCRTS